MKPGTWNPESKSPNFFSGKSIITSMNIKGQVFHPTKVALKHKSFSLYLNRFCPINDKSCFLWISEITFPLFCVLRMALRVALPIWVSRRTKLLFRLQSLFSNINSSLTQSSYLKPETWNTKHETRILRSDFFPANLSCQSWFWKDKIALIYVNFSIICLTSWLCAFYLIFYLESF